MHISDAGGRRDVRTRPKRYIYRSILCKLSYFLEIRPKNMATEFVMENASSLMRLLMLVSAIWDDGRHVTFIYILEEEEEIVNL